MPWEGTGGYQGRKQYDLVDVPLRCSRLLYGELDSKGKSREFRKQNLDCLSFRVHCRLVNPLGIPNRKVFHIGNLTHIGKVEGGELRGHCGTMISRFHT